MLDSVDWFNRKRLPGPIGNFPPADAKGPTTGSKSRCRWRRDSHRMVSGAPLVVLGHSRLSSSSTKQCRMCALALA